jgi:hypothetical protein
MRAPSDEWSMKADGRVFMRKLLQIVKEETGES